MKGDSDFLSGFEIEIIWYPEGWNAYRFGMLVAHSFITRKGLINWLKEYFS